MKGLLSFFGLAAVTLILSAPTSAVAQGFKSGAASRTSSEGNRKARNKVPPKMVRVIANTGYYLMAPDAAKAESTSKTASTSKSSSSSSSSSSDTTFSGFSGGVTAQFIGLRMNSKLNLVAGLDTKYRLIGREKEAKVGTQTMVSKSDLSTLVVGPEVGIDFTPMPMFTIEPAVSYGYGVVKTMKTTTGTEKAPKSSELDFDSFHEIEVTTRFLLNVHPNISVGLAPSYALDWTTVKAGKLEIDGGFSGWSVRAVAGAQF